MVAEFPGSGEEGMLQCANTFQSVLVSISHCPIDQKRQHGQPVCRAGGSGDRPYFLVEGKNLQCLLQSII